MVMLCDPFANHILQDLFISSDNEITPTQQAHDAIITSSLSPNDVGDVKTLSLRHYCVMCPWGENMGKIDTFVFTKSQHTTTKMRTACAIHVAYSLCNNLVTHKWRFTFQYTSAGIISNFHSPVYFPARSGMFFIYCSDNPDISWDLISLSLEPIWRLWSRRNFQLFHDFS